MKQNSYKLEIVDLLSRERLHSRAIAQKLDTNPMMILRKLNELLKENVVDFLEQGRNKSYFLKKTPETRNYFLMAQSNKLNLFIRKHGFLRDTISKMQSDNRIKFALIFGSYVKGIEKKESDIDIYIETSNEKLKKEYSQLHSKLNIKIGKWNNKEDLVKEIKKNYVLIKGGEVLYDRVFN